MPGESFNNDAQFNWGRKIRVVKDIQYYESFTYDGMTYALYDCVFLYGKEEVDPFIGKLIKIWEQPGLKKRVKRIKVLWFFRPNEVLNYLGDDAPLENELFLASGKGLGLCNVNPLEAIAGKCNVICTSKDKRNPHPSSEEVKMADYIFYRTFDVGKYTILDEIEDIQYKTDRVEARYLFNWKGTQKPNGRIEANLNRTVETSNEVFVSNLRSSVTEKDRKPCHATNSTAGRSIPKWESGRTKDAENAEILGAKHFDIEDKQKFVQAHDHLGIHCDRASKKMRLADNSAEYVEEWRKNRSGSSVCKLNVDSDGCGDDDDENESMTAFRAFEEKAKRRLVKDCEGLGMGSSGKLKLDERISQPYDGFNEKALPHPFLKDTKCDREAMEATRRPYVERSKWFTCLPFEDRMWAAYEQGTLVLLEDLSLDYTSEEIEDIVYHAFKQDCTARVIEQSTFSNPHHGQALAIFKSRDAADLVVRKLSKGMLMLANGRCLFGGKATPKAPGKASAFLGHLSIDKVKLQMQREELRKAVSTSHCSQPNTIEYEMAMDWMLLQHKSAELGDFLHKRHGEEVKEIISSLKRR